MINRIIKLFNLKYVHACVTSVIVCVIILATHIFTLKILQINYRINADL